VTTRSFTAPDGVDIVFDDLGEGPPVLLHHGFAADARVNWHQPGVSSAIVESGRRVIALDARGHGRSGKPHDPAAYAGTAMVDDARALLDHLDVERVDAIGYSMGGLVTASLLTCEPRLRCGVLGGVGSRLLLPRPGGNDLAAPWATIADGLEAEDPATVSDPSARAFRAFADSTGADRLALAAIQRSRRAAPADLSSVAVPVLVIAGDKDNLVGNPGRLAAAIPGARHVTVSGDHLSAVADPRFTAELVAFLDEVGAPVA
jgi:pimeloyl-ACP methyl ester carboxylesterase